MAHAPQSTWRELLQRLRWDLMDPFERKSWVWWMIWQIPGLFGNMLRGRHLARRMRACGSELRVYAGCRFRSVERLVAGDRVSIGYDVFLQAYGGITLGNDVTFGPGVKVWSVNHDFQDVDVAVQAQGQTAKPVVIGNDVFIGGNAFILPGVTLPDGCIVIAGAVVNAKAYRPNSILAGNPARVIGYRGGNLVGAGEGES